MDVQGPVLVTYVYQLVDGEVGIKRVWITAESLTLLTSTTGQGG